MSVRPIRIARSLLIGGCCLATLRTGRGVAQDTTTHAFGFEQPDSGRRDRPAGWFINGAGYEIVLDSVAPLAGHYSLRSRRVGPGPHSFGVALRNLPPSFALGRTVRLTGYIRTDGVDSGYAGLWVRVDRGSAMLGLDNMSSHGAHGTTSWTRYEVEQPVDSGASMIVFGVLHPGTGTAWFDSLTIEATGPAMPRKLATLPRVKPIAAAELARPAEDLTRLLTDAELAVPPDSAEPAEGGAWTAWVRQHAHPVRSLGATDFGDLAFLKPLVDGKRIVQIGESGHGVGEFDMAKVRLIKYLHEQAGYDVIAFESSIFECNRADREADSVTAERLLRDCIFQVWGAQETIPLFEYIKATRHTAHPLALAGFDVQTSSASQKNRPAFFRAVVAHVDTAYARQVFDVDSAFIGRTGGGVVPKEQSDRLVAFYDSLATYLRRHERELQAAMPDDPTAARIARQTAVSMTFYAPELAAGPGVEGTKVRDHGMANNLDFLLNEMFPGKKLIVWAHNFHVQHRLNTSAHSDTSNLRTMGTYTVERHRAEMYTVGLFMYRGVAAQNNRQPYRVLSSASGSLESILHRAPWRYSYVDLSKERNAPGTSWMFQTVLAKSWGTQDERMVPRDEYDGVLFIDTVHPPQYLPMTPRGQ